MVGDASVVVAGRLLGEQLAVDRFAGDGEPLFPLPWALRIVVGVEQEVPACWASAVLGTEQPQPTFVQRWWGLLAPPVGPVLGQGWVVRGCRAFHQRVADDPCPGVSDLVGPAVAVAEHPVVLPGCVELTEVALHDPASRLVPVREQSPPVGEPPHVPVQLVEHLAGHHRPVVSGPSPDDRVENADHR